MPGRRTDINEIIGGEYRIFVMLNDNDGIADIAQILERFDEPVVVALMESDGRFIKHIKSAEKALEPSWESETNAQCFPAGKGIGATAWRQSPHYLSGFELAALLFPGSPLFDISRSRGDRETVPKIHTRRLWTWLLRSRYSSFPQSSTWSASGRKRALLHVTRFRAKINA